jgi:hypothetical protein
MILGGRIEKIQKNLKQIPPDDVQSSEDRTGDIVLEEFES